MREQARRAALVRAAERIAEWNIERGDDIQDRAMGEIHLATDAFRDAEGDLPAAGADPAFDALMRLRSDLDASPAAVSRACDRALEIAGVLGAEMPRAAPTRRSA